MIKEQIITKRLLEDYASWTSLNYHINISLKNKYIYVEVPKAASSTIKASLLSLEMKGTNLQLLNESNPFPLSHDSNGWVYVESDLSIVPVHHHPVNSPFVKPYQLMRNDLINLLNSGEFLKFSFVRNPFSRALSAYLEKVKRRQPQAKQILAALNMDSAEGEVDLSFVEFLTALRNIPIMEMDPHWKPQWALCFLPVINYDFIGKIENITRDFERLNALLDMRLTGHVQNYSSHGVDTNSKFEFYDKESIEIVLDIYKDDFNYFGYSRDIPK